MNPYDLLKDEKNIKRLLKVLDIEDSHIFESVLKDSKVANKALSMTLTSISGISNIIGFLGSARLMAIKNDSKTFLANQVARLNQAPELFDEEMSLNMLLFACMGYDMEKSIEMKNKISDAGRLAIGLFSSKNMSKWDEIILARWMECVRWIYSSSILLLIHYMLICTQKKIKFNLPELRELAAYITTLYASCYRSLECFGIDYCHYLSPKYHYIHDLLLENEKPHTLFTSKLNLSKEDIKILEEYCSGNVREWILKDIEENTKSPSSD